jgi:putative colanic acid biosysnthesis UDP-glucose lipid carrier transferase
VALGVSMTAVDDNLKALDLPSDEPTQRSYAFIIKILPGLVLILDALALLAVGFSTYQMLVYHSYQTIDFYTAAIVANSMLGVMLMYFAGLYQFGAITRAISSIDRIVLANLTAFVLMLAGAFAIKISEVYSRLWVGAFLFGGIATLMILRGAVSWGFRKLGERGIVARSVAVYGYGEQVQELLTFLKVQQPTFVKVVGVYGENDGRSMPADSLTEAGDFVKLIDFIRTDNVDDIIVALPWANTREVAALMDKLRELPINVFLSADLVGYKMSMRTPPSYFETLPLFQVAGKPLSGWDVIIKTIEDYLISIVVLILLSPFLLLVAMLIKLDSPGPVIFKQRRLGFNNQIFDIYKFRSMTHAPAEVSKTVQAQRHDPRVTRVGRILRKTSIDEIPQLFNVLNGTMSIVGPRPHAVDHNEEYATKIRGYFSRHRVKPGLTGLAQVKGFRGLTDTVEKMENRVKFDVEYTENWSLMTDLKIILRTPFAVLLGTNAH